MTDCASASPAVMHREVSRVNAPALRPGNVPQHEARLLIEFVDCVANDPFLALAEDWMPHGAFDFHPHRGIEIVTFVLKGALEHRDNAGHQATIHPGDAQWMTAGSGILHEENLPKGELSHTLQLWINLPAAHKMVPTRYQDLWGANMPVRHAPGAQIRVFSGASGSAQSDTLDFVPVTLLEVTLQAGASFTQDLPAYDNAFVVPLDGAVTVGTEAAPLSPGQLAWLTRTDVAGVSDIQLSAGTQPARLLLVSGRPLREPVVQRGPFVMNTEAEVRQAHADYRAGLFNQSSIGWVRYRAQQKGTRMGQSKFKQRTSQPADGHLDPRTIPAAASVVERRHPDSNRSIKTYSPGSAARSGRSCRVSAKNGAC